MNKTIVDIGDKIYTGESYGEYETISEIEVVNDEYIYYTEEGTSYSTSQILELIVYRYFDNIMFPTEKDYENYKKGCKRIINEVNNMDKWYYPFPYKIWNKIRNKIIDFFD